MFRTLDTHKIFFDSDGKRISDIVSISLDPNFKKVVSLPGKDKPLKPSTALSVYHIHHKYEDVGL